jgi:HlyD family secretion protein
MNYETKVEHSDVAHGLSLRDADDSQPASRRWLWIVLALLIVAAIGAFLATRTAEEAAFTGTEGSVPAVTVLAPGSATIEGVINATGTLAARREMPVGVTGEGGRVVAVTVEAGDWVAAGQVLAVVDRSVQSQQAAAQAAQIDVAIADANLAQANLERAQQLVERGFISQADIDRLTATRDAANARVRVARAQLGERQARNAQLNIVAPAAGLVLTRNVEPGQTVSAGSGVLFSIARGGEMELLANLGEDELAGLAVGVTAEVIPAGTDKVFSGQVWQVAPVINEQNRQGVARIALPYALELRPGGFASVRINSGAVVAPMLPESAILSDENGSYVFVVGPENKVVRRPVVTGMITDNGIAISSGLDGSEKVVLRAGGFLAEGEVIRPVTGEDGN